MNKTNLPTEVRLGRAICGHLNQAERREWWLANGLGGYAAGTVAGTLTRRYHGLLIAPVNPPLGRFLILAKADATLLKGDQTVPLFSNRWSDGTLYPQGHLHIESFHLEGRMPVWRFALGDTILRGPPDRLDGSAGEPGHVSQGYPRVLARGAASGGQ